MSDSSSSRSSSPPNPSTSRPFVATRRRRATPTRPAEMVTQLLFNNMYSLDFYNWQDDDIALRAAATQARFPYDRLTMKEMQFFKKYTTNNSTRNLYLFCRNKILLLWQLDPLVELTYDQVLKEIIPPFNSDPDLLKNVFEFLQRYGFINFGYFINLSNRVVLSNRKKVIVIGAGMSGLIAARQLKFFGFDVKLIEGQNRIGGRIFTSSVSGHPVNLGAQVITGIVGNPMLTLIKQLPANVIRVIPRCPIFDFNGKMVNAKKDELIQESFNEILQTCSYIAHGLNLNKIDGETLSLGRAFDAILNQQELRVLDKRLKYYNKYHEIVEMLRELNKKLLLQRMFIEMCMAELNKLVDLNVANSDEIFIDYDQIDGETKFDYALHIRMLRASLLKSIETYEELEKQRKELDRVFTEFKSVQPSEVYMNLGDKRILDFHLANLEYGIGAPLNSASLEFWDHDDDYGFEGSHMMLPEGYDVLVNPLQRNLDVHLQSVVKLIDYDEKGVNVTYAQKSDSGLKTVTEHADVVLCTVPLGVLKTSIGNARKPSAIKFQPPLPIWKRRAISNLGFGSLNKLVLIFESIFWEPTLHTFGRLNETNVSRGELFLFFADGISPMITGLLAGEAASVGDKNRDDYLVSKAMSILRSIFGAACPREPLSHIITQWHLDPYALGCYSYVSTQSTSADYDTLARPVAPPTATAAHEPNPVLFFAGEHTHRQNTASVAGAFLSGLRAAAEIADTLLGPFSTDGK